MRKFFSGIMALFICFSLISCASVEENDGSVFDYDWGSIDNTDYEGAEFIIHQGIYNAEEGDLFNFKRDTPLCDEITVRIDNIQKKHNCVLSVKLVSAIMETMVAGMNPADILYTSHGDIRAYSMAGFIHPIDEYSNIVDYRDSFKWGTPNCLEALMCMGVLYGVLPASWVGNVGGYYFPLVSNNNLLRAKGYSVPHEYIEAGEWTREKFVEVMIGSSDNAAGIFGVETYPEWWKRMCAFSNGFRYTVLKNGEPASGFETEALVDGLEWGNQSLSELRSAGALKESTTDTGFLNGVAAFTIVSGSTAVNSYPYKDELNDISILPFPGNPDYVEYGKWAGYLSVDSTALAIPITTEDVLNTATIMNELFEPLADVQNEADLIDYYAKNVFLYRGDAEVLVESLKNSEFGYWNPGTDGEVFNLFGRVVLSGAPPSTTIENFADTIWENVSKFVVPNKLAYAKYFGFDYFTGLPTE